MSNQSFGKIGEAAAAEYLKNLGYKILARNFRTRWGEIDIIARDEDCLVFAEVKTRHGGAFGAPEEAVTRTKQEHLVKAAQIYLSQTKQSHALWRIDVLALTLRHSRLVSAYEVNSSGNPEKIKDDGFEIHHLKNAVTS
jgi:putative endonuclease